jgi:CBS domain-containing protein
LPLSQFQKGELLKKGVLSVTEENEAIDAFTMMATKEVTSVAITNNEGRLRGNLSLRDLKLIGSDAHVS